MTPIRAENDFVLCFANVNGSGSASANGLVAKYFCHIGLDIGPKNMFPSNIQGLPTWYEIRVNHRGFTGRRGGVDLMVAMNGQTFAEDVKRLRPGGYLLYDGTKPIAATELREDIVLLPIPMTELIRDTFTNARSRLLLKNMVYVGALAAFLDMEKEGVKDLVKAQFKAKPKLIPDNEKAVEIGYTYAQENFACPLGIRVKPIARKKERILLDGNRAAALGCLYGGATVAAWYPITPSTSLVDYFERYCERYRVDGEGKKKFAILQAEDELASIGMVLGASWNGARAFTATSGPGISLMSEFVGFAYYAEVPAVIFNIQRCGPSTGMPTRNQQADLLLCAYASHGDTKHVMLFPSTPAECFEFAYRAFDFAERFQTPVFVMSDLELGMNEYLSEPLQWDESHRYDRGKVPTRDDLEKLKGPFHRYVDADGDGVCYRTLPGVSSKGVFFTRGSGHDRFGRYTEDGELYRENLDRISKKFLTLAEALPEPELELTEEGAPLLIFFGTTLEPLHEALTILRDAGFALNALRLRSFPFSRKVAEVVARHRQLIVIEQNRDGQLAKILQVELGVHAESISSILWYNGLPITAEFLVEEIVKLCKSGGRR